MSTALANLELAPTITVGKHTYQTQPLIPGEQIQERVDIMGQELASRYADRGEVHLVTVMNGALHFASDLRRSMLAANPDLTMTSDQVKVSSYTGTQSSGVLRFQSAPTIDIKDKHLLVVEDILDSGLTLKWLMNYFHAQEPASMEIAIAVDKDNPERRPNLLGSTVMHTGFTIPNEFVIGYGLDVDQEYRDLQGIYTLTPVAA